MAQKQIVQKTEMLEEKVRGLTENLLYYQKRASSLQEGNYRLVQREKELILLSQGRVPISTEPLYSMMVLSCSELSDDNARLQVELRTAKARLAEYEKKRSGRRLKRLFSMNYPAKNQNHEAPCCSRGSIVAPSTRGMRTASREKTRLVAKANHV